MNTQDRPTFYFNPNPNALIAFTAGYRAAYVEKGQEYGELLIDINDEELSKTLLQVIKSEAHRAYQRLLVRRNVWRD